MSSGATVSDILLRLNVSGWRTVGDPAGVIPMGVGGGSSGARPESEPLLSTGHDHDLEAVPMASDDVPEVPIVCAECNTQTRVGLNDAGEVIDRHNTQLHDGDDVARIDPDVAAHVLDMVAQDLGLVDGD